MKNCGAHLVNLDCLHLLENSARGKWQMSKPQVCSVDLHHSFLVDIVDIRW